MPARVRDAPDKCRCRPRARVFNTMFVHRKYLFYRRKEVPAFINDRCRRRRRRRRRVSVTYNKHPYRTNLSGPYCGPLRRHSSKVHAIGVKKN